MTECNVPDCTSPARTRGMCHKHYQRFRRNGDPVAAPPRRGRPKKPETPCSVEDCASSVHSRGMCQRHYRRWKKHGDPGISLTGGGKGRTWSAEEREARAESRQQGTSAPRALSSLSSWRGAHERSKTHCRNGHEFSVENTYVSPRGHRACRKCREVSRIKMEYGLVPEATRTLLATQGDSCAICHTPFTNTPVCVDHFHESGAVRGLLCGECNLGLGKFKDQPALLLAAAQYLLDSEHFPEGDDQFQAVNETIDRRV